MKAELVAVGTKFLQGKSHTNAQFLSEKLAE